jgi:conjugal transfer pilus assembly protein TraF
LVVSRKNGEYLTVGVGVAALTEIEENLYRGIRLLNGEVTPEEYSNYEFQKGGPLEVVPPRGK